MDRKLIKKLGNISFINNRLDEKIVNRIVINLNRQELREYIKTLKFLQSRIRVIVEYSKELSIANKKGVEELFGDKEVVFKKNKNLLMGIRVTENDIVTNMNLNNSLKQIRAFVNKYI